VRLGQAGHLGWTSWMAPNWNVAEGVVRRDARFHPAESLRLKRSRAGQAEPRMTGQ